MCDRVAILKHGRQVHEGRVADLAGDDRIYEIDCDPWDKAAQFLELQGCHILRPGRVGMPPELDPPLMVAALVGLEIRVSAFAPVKRSLEDLYLEITQ